MYMNINNIVTCRQKAGILEPAYMIVPETTE
jgi:hypothetical protein